MPPFPLYLNVETIPNPHFEKTNIISTSIFGKSLHTERLHTNAHFYYRPPLYTDHCLWNKCLKLCVVHGVSDIFSLQGIDNKWTDPEVLQLQGQFPYYLYHTLSFWFKYLNVLGNFGISDIFRAMVKRSGLAFPRPKSLPSRLFPTPHC